MQVWQRPFLAGMKLWQKIFLISLTVVLVAVSITALSVLYSYFSASVQREKEQDLSSHEYYAANLANNVAYQRVKQGQILLSPDEVKQVIESVVSSKTELCTGAAVYDASGLVSKVGMDHLEKQEDFIRQVKENGQCCSLIADAGDRTLLNIGSGIDLEGSAYYIFTAYDITEIYEIYQEQLWFIGLVSVAFALLTGLILWAGVRHLLQPLTKVNASLEKIAQGNYQLRIPEQGSREFCELIGNINVMTEAIEANVEKLQNLADSRKQFIDSLAHEMKTPLTSVMCLGDILRSKRVVTEEERQEYARIIVEDARRLKGLSGKLLELSIADSAPLDFETVDISSLLEEIRDSMAPVLERRHLVLDISTVQAKITVDRDLFQSLLYNLVDNAVKASDDGQQIQIRAEQKGERLILSVEDHGIGMNQEELNKISEPFYMVDKSRSRKAGGVGLGLSLCAAIARRHQASITFQSVPGKGTTVIVSIPLYSGGETNEAD